MKEKEVQINGHQVAPKKDPADAKSSENWKKRSIQVTNCTTTQ